MHMAIAGVAGYYYFAPWGDSADWAMPVTMREHILLHDTLEELDARPVWVQVRDAIAGLFSPYL